MQTKTIAIACAVLIALIGAGSVRAGQHVVPPPVPGDLEVEAGHVPYLMLHAVGTQNQICLPRTSGVGLGWTLWGPQATISDTRGEQILTHYLSANPEEGGVLRATWRHSRDTSTVWAFATATSSDGNYVEPGAIAWLRLQVVGAEDGPTGGDRMSRTTFIQRVNTVGGMAPSTDCAPLGAKLFVPYEADYVFYRKQGPDAQ